MPDEDKVVLRLDKHYRIEADARSWNLIYEKYGAINPDTGKPTLSMDTTYHANLKYALISYLEKDMAEANGLPDLLARIELAEQNVEAAVDRLFEKMK